MSAIHTARVTAAHDYTSAETPWIIDGDATGRAKLVRYISAGGMRTFGRTVAQEIVRRKQLRFLALSAALAVAWAIVYFI